MTSCAHKVAQPSLGKSIPRGLRRRDIGCCRFGGLFAANFLPDLDKCLSFRVAPREAAFLQCIGAPAPTLTPLHRPFRHDASIGEWMKNGRRRIRSASYTTEAIGKIRRRDGWRIHVVDLLFVPEMHREPSLDTPNARPFSASSQGPKLAHRKPLTSPLSPH
jgi:hypothetical protein